MAEETSYDIYLKTTSKREIWKLLIRESDETDHSQVNNVSTDIKTLTINDKEELQNLNHRLSEYIKKVQDLEETNKDLEYQLSQLKNQPARAENVYKNEVKKLQEKLKENDTKMSKLNIDFILYKEKCEKEVEKRKCVEKTLQDFKKKERNATDKCITMEANVASLMSEMIFLEEVIKELSEERSFEHIKSTEERRQKYEREMSQYKRQVETTKTELENLKITKESQEKELKETVTKLNENVEKHKSEISELQKKLTTTEMKMKTQLISYEELSIVNELDGEIQKYKQLMDDGENHIEQIHKENNKRGKEDEEKTEGMEGGVGGGVGGGDGETEDEGDGGETVEGDGGGTGDDGDGGETGDGDGDGTGDDGDGGGTEDEEDDLFT